MSFNKAQDQAIAHKDGPCMVLAGPGSGKTFTLVKRIEYLIKRHKVAPEEILVITFTKAAANEMKTRFRDKMGKQCQGVTFGTFHGIYYGILKWAYGLQAGQILSEVEKEQLLKTVLKKKKIDTEDEKEYIAELLSDISAFKNNGSAKVSNNEHFMDVFEAYERERNRIGKLDFDDMLSQTLSLFQKRSDILKLWQEKFRYIFVDEFQDINYVQYEVLRLLAEPESNLFIVGDDDQSIYGFRGARPDIMLGFTKDYPEAKVIYLSENYRSTKAIINAASRVIKKNQKRYEKGITTQNEQGDTVHIQEVRSTQEESYYIAKEIQNLRKQGIVPKKIAVLFRSAIDARSLVETLAEYHIPFQMKDSIFNLYEHFIGRDLIAYMKLALGDRSRKHFLTVMNRPNRYIGRGAVEFETVSFEELRFYYADMEWMQDRIDQMEIDLRTLKKMAPYAAIQYIRKAIGYDTFLREYALERHINSEELFEILCEIQERSKAFTTAEEWFSHIDEYARTLHILAQEQKEEKDGVHLMTMHGSKGLEFDTVFILGANEGIIPYKKAETKDEIEEERRLFYVAMTRAKKKLIISYAKERGGKKLEMSRFVEEILQGTKWEK